MRKIREVLRLYFAAALSIRAIARSLGTSPSTVGDYLRRAKVAGLGWPLPESVDDTGLERRLFPLPPPSRTARPLPDWSEVHRELRRKSVTLSLLWQEYKETHPEGGGLGFSDNRLRCIPGPWGGTGMTTKRRRRFTADFKKRVALEALRGDRTVQAIAAKHEVHPNQVGTWKRQAVEGLDEVFARGGSPGPSEHEATIRDLHAKIGELTMERDFFQRGLQR